MKRFKTRTLGPAALVVCTGALLSTAAIAGPLSGPDVDASNVPDSLVERNIDGSMKRADLPIAEAALALVTLDASTKASVDRLLAERAASIDEIVKANMQTLNQMRTDRQAGQGDAEGRGGARREGVQKLMEMFKPVLAKGPLEEQLAAIMPEATRVTYLSHIDEHTELMRAERAARAPEGRGGRGGPPSGTDDSPMLFEDPTLEMDAPPPAPREERARRRDGAGRDAERGEDRGQGPRAGRERGAMAAQMGQLRGLQMEIKRSVERIHGENEARTDDFVSQLGLDAEQEAKVRGLMQQGRAAAKESDDPRAARREMMQQISEILTPEQQTKLRELMGNRQGRADAPRRRRPTPRD